jgi:hypothetical protein
MEPGTLKWTIKEKRKDLKPWSYPSVGIMVGGMFSVPALDSLIKARPFGKTVSPTIVAIPVTLLGAWVARKYKQPVIQESLVALSVGLTAGNLLQAIVPLKFGTD